MCARSACAAPLLAPLLLELNSSIHTQSPEPRTFHARSSTRSPSTHPAVATQSGDTPLLIAAYRGHLEAVKLLHAAYPAAAAMKTNVRRPSLHSTGASSPPPLLRA